MKEDKGTSWVADARRLLQDFVTPEVRTLTARLDAMDKVAAERHAVLLDMFERRDAIAAERHQALLDKMEGTRRELMTQIELAFTKSKLEVLEASRSQSP